MSKESISGGMIGMEKSAANRRRCPPESSSQKSSCFQIDTTSMKTNSEGPLYGETVQRKRGSQLQLLDLPKDILCSIISRLPLRDAIRTSILSSHWKYVWRDHTNLTFSCYTLKRGSFGCVVMGEHEFIATVDGVLLHSGTGVELLEFRHPLHNKHADHIDRWIQFAVVSKAKELILHLSNASRTSLSRNMPYELPAQRPQPYSFPCHMFGASEGSYLRCLQLSSVSLKLPVDFNGFPNLKKLIMVDVNITNEHVEYLLSKCSLLEFIEIACCRMLTTLRALRPLSRLEHLKVQDCIFVEQIEMKCGLTILEYSGLMVPLQFATTSTLRNVRIDLTSDTTALDYITKGFPSTLQHLEALNLRCNEQKRAISPVRPLKFIYLRHLRLELNIFGVNEHKKTDVLDYAYLLDCAPSLEKLELHMWMQCHHEIYHAGHGELRSLPLHQHTHLKSVYITGFFGHKDQVELALHILRSSIALKAMKIDSRVKIIPGGPYTSPAIYRTRHYLDGYMVATVFVQGADRNNVVEVTGAIQYSFAIIDGRARFCLISEPEF
ncbi:unnamed protein product [Urochloa decumbens]|uniref:F-box domain-containing protein n=1 Tax=Urochloa decumbens TaxID=240449 RepID=A0ABC9CKG1_9POAL